MLVNLLKFILFQHKDETNRQNPVLAPREIKFQADFLNHKTTEMLNDHDHADALYKCNTFSDYLDVIKIIRLGLGLANSNPNDFRS